MFFPKSTWLLIFTLFLTTGQALAKTKLEERTICTWDPVGKNGPVMSFFSDLVPNAIPWGLDMTFVPYDDENLVLSEFKAGRCDVAIVTAILSRDLVPFAGTLDAIGGITSEKKLRSAMATLTSPKATRYMSEGDFEVVASLPVGSMFAFVNDRRIDNIDRFRNKRIAVLNGDIQTKRFAELAGAIPVNETLSSFSYSFKERNVDIVFMPALAYDTFELNKGLGKTGGILDIRLFYGMIQAVARKSAFEADFGQKMRTYMLDRLKAALMLIKNAEQSIPPHYWIKTDKKSKERLDDFYKDVRLTLKVENKFDAKALSMLWKIRCSNSPNREECEMPQ